MSKKKKKLLGVLADEVGLFSLDGVPISNARVTVNTNNEWTLQGNRAEIVSATNTNRRLATGAGDPVLKLGQNYQITYEVVSISGGGSVRVVCGSNFGTNRTAPGVYVQTINSGTGQQVEIRNFAAGTSAVIIDVEYVEVP